jgi:uncharacterized protein YhdP
VQTNKVLNGVFNSKPMKHKAWRITVPHGMDETARVMATAKPFGDSASSGARCGSHLVWIHPKSYPAMDVVIRQLGVAGLKLGRAEIDGGESPRFLAVVAQRVLNKFNPTLPEASFQAEGQWGGVGRVQAKRTQLDFTFAAAKTLASY